MKKHARAALATVGLFCLAGCSRPMDVQEFIDRRTNEVWMKPGQYVDATEFFAAGGHYYNHPDDPESTPLDEPHIIPLLIRLRDEFQTEQYVILSEKPDVAYAVVMRLPANPTRLAELRSRVDEEDAVFPGLILQEWGREWLSLDFLNEEEGALTRQAWGEEE